MAICALRNVSGFQSTIGSHSDLNFQVVVACICNSFCSCGLIKPMLNSVPEERGDAESDDSLRSKQGVSWLLSLSSTIGQLPVSRLQGLEDYFLVARNPEAI